jgi:putative cell wall-binding protein
MRVVMVHRMVLAIALIASTFVVVAPTTPVAAADEEIYPLVFPVVGSVYFTDTFGACRSGCSRTHLGNDLMTYGLKGVPIVAAHDGVVVRTSTESGRECCAIWGIRADDGWETWYIHMNNDNPGTDDGLGWGFAAGIEAGRRVEAGELIGWVGDSGNAEGVGPHLHFELRRPDGTAISPYASLISASRVDLPRLAGDNRFITAAEIAESGFSGGSDTVFITTGRAFPDALAVGAASAALEVPILLTEPDTIPLAARNALDTIDPSRIIVVGGPAAVSDRVAAQLGLYGAVERIGGVDRFQTAALAADALFDTPSTVYLTNGYSYPEAVAAAVAAGVSAGPLLLTDTDRLPGLTKTYLEGLDGVQVVVVGSTARVSAAVADEVRSLSGVASVTRIESPTDTGLSVAVSQAAFPAGADRVYLATALDFADALAGASLAGRMGAPVLLLDANGLDAAVDEATRLGASQITVLGGPAAVGYDWIVPFWNKAVGNTMPTWNSHG